MTDAGRASSLNSMLETTPGDLTRQRKNRGKAENLMAAREDGQALIEFRHADQQDDAGIFRPAIPQ